MAPAGPCGWGRSSCGTCRTWRIQVPTVILHGRSDEAVPLAESEAYRDRNPGTVLHVLEDDHGLLASRSLECLRTELEAAFG